jgi:hypothetical protein
VEAPCAAVIARAAQAANVKARIIVLSPGRIMFATPNGTSIANLFASNAAADPSMTAFGFVILVAHVVSLQRIRKPLGAIPTVRPSLPLAGRNSFTWLLAFSRLAQMLAPLVHATLPSISAEP